MTDPTNASIVHLDFFLDMIEVGRKGYHGYMEPWYAATTNIISSALMYYSRNMLYRVRCREGESSNKACYYTKGKTFYWPSLQQFTFPKSSTAEEDLVMNYETAFQRMLAIDEMFLA